MTYVKNDGTAESYCIQVLIPKGNENKSAQLINKKVMKALSGDMDCLKVLFSLMKLFNFPLNHSVFDS